VQAGRGQADQNIARADLFARDQIPFPNRPDDAANEVVFALRIQPGHFRRFAADQRAMILAAGFAQPLN
jgi:hypothetical protein